jgi:hypothetical protein
MKFNFKSISYLLIGLILGSLIPIQSLLAESPIRLLINGQYINCDVQPQIINGRTMVPVSIISTALGATVSWDENTQTVIINGQGMLHQQFQILNQQLMILRNKNSLHLKQKQIHLSQIVII